MKLPFEVLKDKVLGCWNGKNAGGVLGEPMEWIRQINNVEFYTQQFEKGNPPANDDLDLQLEWLIAVERYGRHINASILGDYWLSFITPNWVEYGTGKSNMRRGIVPPLSGYLSNEFKDSCGCYIRSELWACLCPGHPELAVRYAYEDGIVDHADEGLYAEIFCAAVESAAFAASDKYALINIGLSYIPADCTIAKAIRLVINAYQSGVPYLEARALLFNQYLGDPIKQGPDNSKFPCIRPGFDAPSNIGIIIIGWLYGEDDFGKSLCIAVNCGEDTDCTAATLGSILGIIQGNNKLPTKWLEPLGGKINTCCINLTSHPAVPKTVDELTDRVLRMIPEFLNHDRCDILYSGNGFSTDIKEGEALYCQEDDSVIHLCAGAGCKSLSPTALAHLSPFCVQYSFSTFNAIIDYIDEPYIKANQVKKLKLTIYDSGLTCHQQWANIKLYPDEDLTVVQGTNFSAPLQNRPNAKIEVEFELLAEQIHSSQLSVLIDISIAGRHTNGIIKATFYPTV